MLALIVAEDRADTLFLVALRSLLESRDPHLVVRPGQPDTGFVPRVEDEASGRWLAILEDSDPMYRACRALTLGASGVILPTIAPGEFDEALEALARPRATYVPSALLNAMATSAVVPRPESPHATEALTAREMEILRLVAQGLSNTEIAGRLSVSVNTVRTHLRSLFRKLDVVSRTSLVTAAWRMGLVPDSEPPVAADWAPRSRERGRGMAREREPVRAR